MYRSVVWKDELIFSAVECNATPERNETLLAKRELRERNTETQKRNKWSTPVI